MRTDIIPCGKTKRESASRADDLYQGSSFKAARRAAESLGLPWLILSAKYGLMHRDKIIEPYEMTYGKSSGCPPHIIRRQGLEMIPDGQIISLCPKAYTNVLQEAFGEERVIPILAGLSMGYQRQVLNRIAAIGSIDMMRH